MLGPPHPRRSHFGLYALLVPKALNFLYRPIFVATKTKIDMLLLSNIRMTAGICLINHKPLTINYPAYHKAAQSSTKQHKDWQPSTVQIIRGESQNDTWVLVSREEF